MYEDYVVAAAGDAAERNMQEKIRLKNLRDSSNPFELREEKFKKLFRLPRSAAHHLIETLVDPRFDQGTIPKYIKVLAALNFFAHGSYQAGIGEDSFLGLSQPSASRCITLTASAIVNELAQDCIKFPLSLEEKQRAKRDFMDLYGIPDVLGAIDGTHIAIFKPPINHPTAPGSLFFNRKGFYSINVQMVVSAKGKILSVNPNFPGSTHDAAVWTMSHLKQMLQTEYVNTQVKQWLLGDKAYPLQPWLLSPIQRPQNVAEERYNECHTNARNVVEMCHGRLKNKFRCLHGNRTLHYEPPAAAKIIVACCALYNKFTEVLDTDSEDSDDDEDFFSNPEEAPEEAPADMTDDDFLDAARRIRDTLIQDHFNY